MFLRRCQRRMVGCNDVEHFVKKIPSRFLRNKQRRSMMNNKLNDARFQEEKAKKKFLKEFNYLSRRWGVQNPYFMSQFNILMQREVEETWQDGRERVLSKLEFLAQKWHRVHNTVPPDIDGVIISDEKLEEVFGPITEDNPLTFGGFEYSENEAELAKLPHNFRTFPKLDKEDINVSTQAMFAKVRWELRNKEERNGEPWTPEWQWEQTSQKTVYNGE